MSGGLNLDRAVGAGKHAYKAPELAIGGLSWARAPNGQFNLSPGQRPGESRRFRQALKGRSRAAFPKFEAPAVDRFHGIDLRVSNRSRLRGACCAPRHRRSRRRVRPRSVRPFQFARPASILPALVMIAGCTQYAGSVNDVAEDSSRGKSLFIDTGGSPLGEGRMAAAFEGAQPIALSDRRAVIAIIASTVGFSLDMFDLFILLYVAPAVGKAFFPSTLPPCRLRRSMPPLWSRC